MFNPISNIEKEFLVSNLTVKGIREGNRGATDYRYVSITRLEENGQVEVKIGDTLVISQIFAKLVYPNPDRQNEGIIVFTIDSNHFRPNAEYTQSNEELSELRTKVSNVLEKSLRESKALDTFSLCVVPGKLVWKIVVDINLINNDGNIFDACVLATLASWKSFKIPFLRKSGNKVVFPKNNQMIALSALHIPLSVTVGVFDVKILPKMIIDPTLKEEQCMDGLIVVSANKFNEICYIHTYYSVQIDGEWMNDLLVIVKDKISYLHKILMEFLEKSTKDDMRIGKRDISMDLEEKFKFGKIRTMDQSKSKDSKVTKLNFLVYEKK